MKREFCKSRMPMSRAQTGTRRVRRLPRPRTKHDERASREKRRGTAVLQNASAYFALSKAATFWSAAVFCRFWMCSRKRVRVFNLRLGKSRAANSLVLLFLLTATVFSVLPLLRYLRGHTIFDYELWYATGKHVLAGDEIYFFRAGKYDFMYPPPCALFLAGASLLGQGGLILLLVIINSAAWFCSAKFSAILSIGNRSAINWWLYFVPSLLVIVYVWSSYHLGQPNLVLLALMLCGFVSLRTKREVVGGGFIAVAAAIKALPILATASRVYARYWTAAGSLIVTLAFLLLILPAPFRGFERAWHDLAKWRPGVLNTSAVT